METVIKDRKSGKELIFRLQRAFLKNYLNSPYDKQAAEARRVAIMPDDRISVYEGGEMNESRTERRRPI
jgi:hypothetical protein